MFARILATGDVIVHTPDALVHHRHRVDEAGLDKQIRGNGSGMAALLTKAIIAKPSVLGTLATRVPGVLNRVKPGGARVAGTDEDALLRTAIRLHNAYRLPEEMDDRTRMFCQILRDADKIDILRVNVETPMEQIYNVSTEALRQSPISPAVLDAFYEHHCVLRTLNHYPADNAVGHASFVFELCYPESLRAVAEQGWLWKLLDFKTENPDTAKAFAGMKAEMQRWLEEHAK